jgi:cell division protein FtsQ
MPENREKPKSRNVPIALLSHAFMISVIVVGIGAVFFIEVQAEGFLKRDSRFFLEPSPDYTEPPPNLKIEGAAYTDTEEVVRVFEQDLRRSIAYVDLKQRRHTLMGLPWVYDASVSRLWPNSLHVRIVERKPVAFLKPAAGQPLQLIDADGEALPVPPKFKFQLPVVDGISSNSTEEHRRQQMARVLKLIAEFEQRIEEVSEIDAHDMHNLVVTRKYGNRGIALKLGNKNFWQRYSTFIPMADELLQRFPNARTFDLRIDDQIIIPKEGSSNAAEDFSEPRRINGR